MRKPIRVLVVDDHEILANALLLLFSRHPVFELVGCASGAEEAVKMTTLKEPAVVLMDLELPGLDPVDVTRRIRAARPSAKIVAVTSFKDPVAAAHLLAAGAWGYIQKTKPVEEVLDQARRAAEGEIIMPDADLAEVVDQLRARVQPRPISELGLRQLTARETEILRSLAAGDSTAAIAELLAISPLTVQGHVKSILSKLGVHSQIEAVVLAWRNGLVPAPRTASQSRS